MVTVPNRGLAPLFEAWMGSENKVPYLVFPCGKINQLLKTVVLDYLQK